MAREVIGRVFEVRCVCDRCGLKHSYTSESIVGPPPGWANVHLAPYSTGHEGPLLCTACVAVVLAAAAPARLAAPGFDLDREELAKPMTGETTGKLLARELNALLGCAEAPGDDERTLLERTLGYVARRLVDDGVPREDVRSVLAQAIDNLPFSIGRALRT